MPKFIWNSIVSQSNDSCRQKYPPVRKPSAGFTVSNTRGCPRTSLIVIMADQLIFMCQHPQVSHKECVEEHHSYSYAIIVAKVISSHREIVSLL